MVEDINDFRIFLKKYRKNNGEYLLQHSIDKFVYYISKHFSRLSVITSLPEYIEYMNHHIKIKNNNVLRASFKNYLLFKGFDVEKTGEVVESGITYKLIRTKHKQISAFSSKRYMQSKVLKDEEVQRILEMAPDLQMKTIISFLFDLGIRREELMNLKFRDIKFINPNDPNFKLEKDAGIYAYVTIFGKGAKTRTGYLHKTSVSYLRQLYPGEVNIDDNIFVFYKDNENKVEYIAQTQKLYEEFRKLGLKSIGKAIHPHMARHTLLTNLAKMGFSDSALQNISGHTSPTMVHRYVENTDSTGKNAMIERGKDLLDNNMN